MSSTRTRSPRYPSHALPEAIEYSERIYDALHRSSFDSETAFRLMGFAGKSGASATALGSVRQYGLIEGSGDNTKISDLALRILEPESDLEFAEAVLVAARQPDVFQSIYDRFNDRIPTVDEPIRAFLIRDLGFSKNGVDDCIAALRNTIYFCDMHKTAEMSHRSSDISSKEAVSVSRQNSSNEQLMRIPLTKECSAELVFSGNVTDKAIANLLRHIELMKDVWAED